ncbi:MAG: SUMF1/EgtB/PvdO family nonheme iron enzyme [Oscillibacter sp.]|nr:SUMF1/EgtB/PvdO family nonheme iron enzyme [Oscillibacter sp.]
MANNFDLSALALAMACPGNVQLLDDKGLPGAYVPRTFMRLNALLTNGDSSVHPAFLYNGVQKDTLYFGKYPACVNLNRAYSLPGVDLRASIDFNTALQYCRNKGSGHHLITFAEWAFLALLAKKRGTMPKGNNNYGKDASESLYLAIPTYKDGNTGQTLRTATGTGPLTWSDTGDATGVMDLNGNVWEWNAGMRLVRGELQFIPYNNAADPTVDMSATSTAWKAIKATATSYNDLYITPNGAGTTSGSVKLDYVSNHWQYAASATSAEDTRRSAQFKLTTASGLSDFCKMYLQAMALLPEDGDTDYGEDVIYAMNGANECLMYRGGAWPDSNTAGVFSIKLDNPRGNIVETLGFRPAFVNL